MVDLHVFSFFGILYWLYSVASLTKRKKDFTLHTSILATLFVVERDEFKSSRLMIYDIAIEASVVSTSSNYYLLYNTTNSTIRP